jgi:hypothetical protein
VVKKKKKLLKKVVKKKKKLLKKVVKNYQLN